MFEALLSIESDSAYACADDVLVVLGAISRLPILAWMFQITCLATRLRLNLGKCFLAPLWSRCASFGRELLQDSLARLCPEWMSVAVSGNIT